MDVDRKELVNDTSMSQREHREPGIPSGTCSRHQTHLLRTLTSPPSFLPTLYTTNDTRHFSPLRYKTFGSLNGHDIPSPPRRRGSCTSDGLHHPHGGLIVVAFLLCTHTPATIRLLEGSTEEGANLPCQLVGARFGRLFLHLQLLQMVYRRFPVCTFCGELGGQTVHAVSTQARQQVLMGLRLQVSR